MPSTMHHEIGVGGRQIRVEPGPPVAETQPPALRCDPRRPDEPGRLQDRRRARSPGRARCCPTRLDSPPGPPRSPDPGHPPGRPATNRPSDRRSPRRRDVKAGSMISAASWARWAANKRASVQAAISSPSSKSLRIPSPVAVLPGSSHRHYFVPIVSKSERQRILNRRLAGAFDPFQRNVSAAGHFLSSGDRR